TVFYTLYLHDALPICMIRLPLSSSILRLHQAAAKSPGLRHDDSNATLKKDFPAEAPASGTRTTIASRKRPINPIRPASRSTSSRSEEHTSELQSHLNL